MPIVVEDCGGTDFSVTNDQTYYIPFAGTNIRNSGEQYVQFRDVGRAFTARDLLVLITENSRNGATPIYFRDDGVNTALTVSIPASTTGVFEDTTNSASVAVDSDLSYSVGVGGTTGSYRAHHYSITVDQADVALRSWQAYSVFGNRVDTASTTVYSTVSGELDDTPWITTESQAQLKARSAGTWKRLGVYCYNNVRSSATTLRSRIGGSNGNQVISVPASTTGFFQDTTNTDSVTAGNLINYSWTSGAGGDAIDITVLQSQFENSANPPVTDIIAALSFGTPWTINFGLTRYISPIGTISAEASESDAEFKLRGPDFMSSNLFVRIETNTVNGSTTIRTRVNQANGAMSVSVPSSTTGIFEDTTNVDYLVYADDISIQAVTGGTSGALGIQILSQTLTQGPVVSQVDTSCDLGDVPQGVTRHIIQNQRGNKRWYAIYRDRSNFEVDSEWSSDGEAWGNTPQTVSSTSGDVWSVSAWWHDDGSQFVIWAVYCNLSTVWYIRGTVADSADDITWGTQRTAASRGTSGLPFVSITRTDNGRIVIAFDDVNATYSETWLVGGSDDGDNPSWTTQLWDDPSGDVDNANKDEVYAALAPFNSSYPNRFLVLGRLPDGFANDAYRCVSAVPEWNGTAFSNLTKAVLDSQDANIAAILACIIDSVDIAHAIYKDTDQNVVHQKAASAGEDDWGTLTTVKNNGGNDIDACTLVLDTNPSTDDLYAFYHDAQDTTDFHYKTSPVDTVSWSAERTVTFAVDVTQLGGGYSTVEDALSVAIRSGTSISHLKVPVLPAAGQTFTSYADDSSTLQDNIFTELLKFFERFGDDSTTLTDDILTEFLQGVAAGVLIEIIERRVF